MNSNTAYTCIGDLVDLQRGNTYQSKLLDLPGPYLLGLASIGRDGGFRNDKLRTYGGPTSDRLLVYPGDIYVSLKDVTQSGDLLGSAARVPNEIDVGRVTQDTVKLVFKNDSAPRNYIYWILRTPQYRSYCRARGMGTTNLSLSREDFLSFPIKELSDEKNKFVALLESIESKMSLNRRAASLLEQIAQTIFKSWFVDFDPVRAKIEGHTPHGMDTSTAAQFPAQMEESELGLIPSGWLPKPIYETAGYTNGSVFKISDFSLNENGLPIVKIAELKKGVTAQTKFTEKDFPHKYLIDSGDVCYSWSGSPETSLDVFRWQGGKGWLNQHIFKLNFESESQKYFTYYLLKQMRPVLVQTALNKQTTGLGHITIADMKRIKIVYPDQKAMEAFAEKVSPIYKQEALLHEQMASLEELRDVLLPKLMVDVLQDMES
jgi:type I restriction enzyme S subunit